MKHNILVYNWLGIFNEDTTIHQFDEQEQEHSFREFNDRKDLKYFVLYHKDKNLEFIVDCVNYIVIKNSEKKEIIYNFINNKNIKINYIRQHKIDYGLEDLKVVNHNIIYLIELQLDTKKIIIKIDKDGNYTIEE